jgi:hypothetical protein
MRHRGTQEHPGSLALGRYISVTFCPHFSRAVPYDLLLLALREAILSGVVVLYETNLVRVSTLGVGAASFGLN